MKTPLALLTVCIILFSSCIFKAQSEKDSDFKISGKANSFTQKYHVLNSFNLKLTTPGGNISTTGYNGKEVVVDFVVKKYGNVLDVDLEDLKKMAQVEIFNDGSNLEINVIKIYEKCVSVGFSVKTPIQTATFLNTFGGNIYIENLEASQDISTGGGTLSVKGIKGQVDASSSGGDIRMEQSVGDLNASTSGGDIKLMDLKGNVRITNSGGNIEMDDGQGCIDLRTSGGSIHMDKVFGTVKAITSGGDIYARIDKLTCPLDLETSGGNIDCTIPKGIGIDLNVLGGHIDTRLFRFIGIANNQKIQGKVDGGGLPVRLSTEGGTVKLEYR